MIMGLLSAEDAEAWIKNGSVAWIAQSEALKEISRPRGADIPMSASELRPLCNLEHGHLGGDAAQRVLLGRGRDAVGLKQPCGPVVADNRSGRED